MVAVSALALFFCPETVPYDCFPQVRIGTMDRGQTPGLIFGSATY